jgi:hypothetical protein
VSANTTGVKAYLISPRGRAELRSRSGCTSLGPAAFLTAAA